MCESYKTDIVMRIRDLELSLAGKRVVVSGTFKGYAKQDIIDDLISLGAIIDDRAYCKTDIAVFGKRYSVDIEKRARKYDLVCIYLIN